MSDVRPKLAVGYQIHRIDKPDVVVSIADHDRAARVLSDLRDTFPARGYTLRVVYWRELDVDDVLRGER